MGRICGSRIRYSFLATGKGVNEAVLLSLGALVHSYIPNIEG
jgi:hypothetical protein